MNKGVPQRARRPAVRFCLIACCVFAASAQAGPVAVAVVQAATATAGTPKRAAKKAPVDDKQAKKAARAHAVVRGYYDALIAGDFEAASGFLDPRAVAPLRTGVFSAMARFSPAQKKRVLSDFGVASESALRSLSPEKFYVVYARSPFGRDIALMAHPDLKTRVVIERVQCSAVFESCDVDVVIHATGPEGPIERRTVAFVEKIGGRWLVNDRPRR